MLAKRIIPCLDIKNGRTVKGVNFVDLRDAGDPVELAEIYWSCAYMKTKVNDTTTFEDLLKQHNVEYKV